MGNIITIPVSYLKNSFISTLKADKEIFFELGNNIKEDYNLIKELFNEFKHDLSFLNRVLEDINNNVDEEWTLEFNILYLRLLEEHKRFNAKRFLIKDPLPDIDLIIQLYKMIISMKTNAFLDELEQAINNKGGKVIGMGFMVIENRFYYSEVIKNYYAEEFIRRIFQNPNLESYLHQIYIDFEDIESIGIITFIRNYIAESDIALADYVISHQEVLSELIYALEFIKANWETYRKAHGTAVYQRGNLNQSM